MENSVSNQNAEPIWYENNDNLQELLGERRNTPSLTIIDNSTVEKISALEKGDKSVGLKIKDNGGSRMVTDRRQFSIPDYAPEKRSGRERRSGTDRRTRKRNRGPKAIERREAFRMPDKWIS